MAIKKYVLTLPEFHVIQAWREGQFWHKGEDAGKKTDSFLRSCCSRVTDIIASIIFPFCFLFSVECG